MIVSVKLSQDNYPIEINLRDIKKEYREEMQEVMLELQVKTAVFLKKISKESKNPKFKI